MVKIFVMIILLLNPINLLNGCEVEPEAGSPMREVEVKNRHYGDERDALQCNPPIGEIRLPPM